MVEKLHSYLCGDLFKELDSGETKLGFYGTSEGQVMLKNMKSKPPVLATLCRWTKKIGWKYNIKRKTLYVYFCENPI